MSDLVNFKFNAFSFTMRYIQFQYTCRLRLHGWQVVALTTHTAAVPQRRHTGSEKLTQLESEAFKQAEISRS